MFIQTFLEYIYQLRITHILQNKAYKQTQNETNLNEMQYMHKTTKTYIQIIILKWII